MKPVYYEMKREDFDKPYAEVKVWLPSSKHNEPVDMPGLIFLETGYYDKLHERDVALTCCWDTTENQLAFAIREAIKAIDSIYEEREQWLKHTQK